LAKRYVISKFGDLETATAATLVPTVMVRFNLSDIHQQLSNYEFVKRQINCFIFANRRCLHVHVHRQIKYFQ